MTDIARLAGAHGSTESRALAGNPLAEARKPKRIEQPAREDGGVVDPFGRSLTRKRTQKVSVVIPPPHRAAEPCAEPFLMAMIGHLAETITRRGYGMSLHRAARPMRGWLGGVIAGGDGVVMIGRNREHEALQRAAATGVPLVVWGGRMAGQKYCTVGCDNAAVGRAAVRHLLSTQRRRIVFLGGPAGPELRQRYEGYVHALREAPRGTAAPRLIPARLTPDAAYRAMRACIRAGESFDAVFAATDVIAVGAIRALANEGRVVPRDVAVVGVDDNVFAAHTTPSLTTVQQDLERGAHVLIDLLSRRMEGEPTVSVTLPVELIIRESAPA